MTDDLRHFRADHPSMVRLAATLWITAIVLVLVTSVTLANQNAAPQAQPSSLTTPATSTGEPAWAASQLAEIVAACMNGDQFIWTDPHTGSDFAAFCHVVELGRLP